jgi:hypothetical protein
MEQEGGMKSIKRQLCDVAADILKIAAESELKTVEWVDVFHGFGTCSVCDHRNVIDNYCANCGAEMRGKCEVDAK